MPVGVAWHGLNEVELQLPLQVLDAVLTSQWGMV